MSATIIDGKAVAEEITQRVRTGVEECAARTGRAPQLAAVQAGDNPASRMYVKMQEKSCSGVGIDYRLLTLDEDINEDQLLAEVAQLNADDTVDGIILQLPLPAGIDARKIQASIDPGKDVEGISPANLGRLFYGDAMPAPCTPLAAMALLERTCGDMAGKEAVVVGHSEIVGKPIAMMLLKSPNASPTVTVCHIATADLAAHTKRADILVTAAGVSQAKWLGYRKSGGEGPSPDLAPLVSAEMLKPGCVVIDVAINRIPKGLDENNQPLKREDGKTDMQTVGDVDFDAAKEVASAITPVPGGVGPVTVAKLLENTLFCATDRFK